jgi:23S rRNA pseudouridine1911/1915/1917 synthase
MHTIHVTEAGPLLEVLARELKNRTLAKQHLKFRRLSVNGVPADRHDHPLKPGDVLRIGTAHESRRGHIPGLPVVYEDDAVLLVDKPEGLLTVSTDAEKENTAYARARRSLNQAGGKVFIVHRLDRETSGLLLLAKTEEAKRTLQASWDEVEKHYFAVVAGTPEPPAGTIESFLAENAAFRVYSGPQTEHSKHAVTHYRVVSSAGGRSLLEIRTATGRKHQIRVHLADLGHPIVGDDKYGGAKDKRLALHACSLRFPHPTTGEPLEFRSELPGAMRRALKAGRSSAQGEQAGSPGEKRPRDSRRTHRGQ